MLKENTESYVWLFENFKKAMGHEPYIIMTDQDPAVIVAIQQVFQTATHRFCMWHIMFKLSDKVDSKIYNTLKFKQEINALVWDSDITKQQFEERWENSLEEFQLQNNEWLERMCRLRKYWILTFFNDIRIGGLIRTTSRSESQNTFFGGFLG